MTRDDTPAETRVEQHVAGRIPGHISDYYNRSRGNGHTRALVEMVANHLVRNQHESVVMWTSTQAAGHEIRQQVFEKLLHLVPRHIVCVDGDATGPAHKLIQNLRILSVHDDAIREAGRKSVAVVDNSAMMELATEWDRQNTGYRRTILQKNAHIATVEVENRNLSADVSRLEGQNRKLQVEGIKQADEVARLTQRVAALEWDLERETRWEKERQDEVQTLRDEVAILSARLDEEGLLPEGGS